MSRPRFRLLAGACFLATGAAGLIYQLVWSRYLALILGSAHYSVATVVASYMAGLGLGAALLGRIADRSRQPARLYALLEIAIAAYGAASPWIFDLVRWLFALANPTDSTGVLPSLGLRVALALGVLLLPTALMGGTLPVLARALSGAERGPSTSAARVGWLYALNTLGAVIGASAAGFVLIEHLGLKHSLVLAATINALAGVLVLAARMPALDPDALPEPEASPGSARPPSPRFAAVAAFVIGFAALADEVIWTRVLSLLTGSSTWAFATILSIFLLGIGLGAAFGARRPPRDPALRLFWTQLLAASGATMLLVLYEPACALILASAENPIAGWGSLFAIRALVVAVAVLPACLGFGASFPALLALAGERDRSEGTRVGLIYAFNTLGAILGSLAAGFLLLHWFSSYGVLRAGVLASLAIAIAALTLSVRGSASRSRPWTHALAAAVPAIAVIAIRPWPAHLLELGAASHRPGRIQSWLDVQAFLSAGRHQISFFREGPVATVSVRDAGHARFLRVDGRTEASTSADMATQIGVGLLPVLARPTAERVLLVGGGSGVTARALTSAPALVKLDVVEIEHSVIDAGGEFLDVNDGVYSRAGVAIHIDDGRNFLLGSGSSWDIIVSQPSNAWMPGVAALFTREYYDLVRQHLTPGGVFCQWLQRYDVSEPTFQRLLATLAASFPEVSLWLGGPGDTLVLASMQPIRFDADPIQRVIAGAEALHPGELAEHLGLVTIADLPALYLLGDAGVREYAAGSRPYADDPPELEFAAFRELRASREWTGGINGSLLAVKLARGDDAPPAVPEHPPAVRALATARVALALGSPDEARAVVERLAGSELSARGLRLLGDIHAAARDEEHARQAWEAALIGDPGELMAGIALARLALSRGDLETALRIAHTIPAEAGHYELEMLRAELALTQSSWLEALAAAERAWELGRGARDRDSLYRRLRLVYRRAAAPDAEPTATIASLRHWIAREPRMGEMYLMLAELLADTNRCAEALEPLTWLEHNGGRSIDMLLRLGKCQQATGRQAEASKTWGVIARYAPWRLELSPDQAGGAAELSAPR